MTERDPSLPPATADHSADPQADGRAGGSGQGLQRLDPRAVTLWRLGYLLRGAFFAAVILGAELLMDVPFPAGLLAFVAGVAAVFVAVLLPPAQHRRWGYRLGESDLYLRHGVLMRTTTIVPHARIQHVDTRHGPIDRALGLANVVVYTAGTRGAMIAIPALEATTAEALRDRLVALSGAGDAV